MNMMDTLSEKINLMTTRNGGYDHDEDENKMNTVISSSCSSVTSALSLQSPTTSSIASPSSTTSHLSPFLDPLMQLKTILEKNDIMNWRMGQLNGQPVSMASTMFNGVFTSGCGAGGNSNITSNGNRSSPGNKCVTVPVNGSGISYTPDADITGELYKCHLCDYKGNSKSHFNEHMNTHFEHKCMLCDYTSRTEGRLKRHVKDFHSEVPPDSWAGSKTSRHSSDGNSSGDSNTCFDSEGGHAEEGSSKKRKYKCKQCNFIAINKKEFWDHSKEHIKSEKLLICPKCPFVTEYKHHLEYHLRNHFGSKPFKCAKCNYSCVNKSMLNSHMKSHSNIYQYRCSDCSYATKYCHSLKLHLRKYSHKPATVLNLDGTPNPYPVIDVYGTRRGPRPKKNKANPLKNASQNDQEKNTQEDDRIELQGSSVGDNAPLLTTPVSPSVNQSMMSSPGVSLPPLLGSILPSSLPMSFPFRYPQFFNGGLLSPFPSSQAAVSSLPVPFLPPLSDNRHNSPSGDEDDDPESGDENGDEDDDEFEDLEIPASPLDLSNNRSPLSQNESSYSVMDNNNEGDEMDSEPESVSFYQALYSVKILQNYLSREHGFEADVEYMYKLEDRLQINQKRNKRV